MVGEVGGHGVALPRFRVLRGSGPHRWAFLGGYAHGSANTILPLLHKRLKRWIGLAAGVAAGRHMTCAAPDSLCSGPPQLEHRHDLRAQKRPAPESWDGWEKENGAQGVKNGGVFFENFQSQGSRTCALCARKSAPAPGKVGWVEEGKAVLRGV